jgi:hypothetical protein
MRRVGFELTPTMFERTSTSLRPYGHYDRLEILISENNFLKYILGMYILRMTASVLYSSEFLATDPEVLVRFPALPDFLRSSGSGSGFTQPREYN